MKRKEDSNSKKYRKTGIYSKISFKNYGLLTPVNKKIDGNLSFNQDDNFKRKQIKKASVDNMGRESKKFNEYFNFIRTARIFKKAKSEHFFNISELKIPSLIKNPSEKSRHESIKTERSSLHNTYFSTNSLIGKGSQFNNSSILNKNFRALRKSTFFEDPFKKMEMLKIDPIISNLSPKKSQLSYRSFNSRIMSKKNLDDKIFLENGYEEKHELSDKKIEIMQEDVINNKLKAKSNLKSNKEQFLSNIYNNKFINSFLSKKVKTLSVNTPKKKIKRNYKKENINYIEKFSLSMYTNPN